jgi:sugar phosphate permease
VSPGPTPVSIGRRRWLMLALGLVAQAASSAFLYGLPFLLPELRRTYGLSLAQAGLLVSAPSLGLVATLVAWGAFVDRFGERLAMSLGLGLTGALVALTRVTDNLVVIGLLFGLAGAASGSVNAASGRVVIGWFGAHERGLAMGARQMAQPIGVALAALVLPPLAAAVGLRDALLAPAAFCGFVAALVVALVKDPPRPERGVGPPSANPYRTSTLWRLHASSALLVVPQFVVTVFSEEYLVAVRHWPAGSAGRVLALVQLAGACGRLVVGRWSDHVGSRLRPMRQIAVLSAAAMIAVGAACASGSAVILLALAAATVISVTDNGLGFTATAELAGRAWSGRALGMQNTGQNIVAFATPSLFAFLVGQLDYAGAFMVCAVFPAIGVFTTPVQAERAAIDATAERSQALARSGDH